MADEKSKEGRTTTAETAKMLQAAADMGALSDVIALIAQWKKERPKDQLTRRSEPDAAGFTRQSNHYFGEAIVCAAIKDYAEIVEAFFQGGFSIDMPAVRAAIQSRSYRTLDIMLRYGWDMDTRWGWYVDDRMAFDTCNVLYPSGYRRYMPAICYAICLNDIDFVQWFLDHGASACVLSADKAVWGPLSTAVAVASLSIVKLLVDYGAKVDRGNVVHALVRRGCPERLEKIDYLLSLGAPMEELLHTPCPPQVRALLRSNDEFRYYPIVPLPVFESDGDRDMALKLADEAAKLRLASTRQLQFPDVLELRLWLM